MHMNNDFLVVIFLRNISQHHPSCPPCFEISSERSAWYELSSIMTARTNRTLFSLPGRRLTQSVNELHAGRLSCDCASSRGVWLWLLSGVTCLGCVLTHITPAAEGSCSLAPYLASHARGENITHWRDTLYAVNLSNRCLMDKDNQGWFFVHTWMVDPPVNQFHAGQSSLRTKWWTLGSTDEVCLNLWQLIG